jgi:VIT1/CCC1 family predicted Fe2+/Mn2+ transporter
MKIGRAARAPSRGRIGQHAGIVGFALAVGGFIFCLAYAAVEEPAIAVILTLLIMLPAAGFASSPSNPGPMRR